MHVKDYTIEVKSALFEVVPYVDAHVQSDDTQRVDIVELLSWLV